MRERRLVGAALQMVGLTARFIVQNGRRVPDRAQR